MTGPEFAAIRKSLGLTTAAWGRAIGYTGTDNVVASGVRRYESSGREIPTWIARLALMYGRHGIPADL
jgi:hypothetical protein